jgi:hypothetical protein
MKKSKAKSEFVDMYVLATECYQLISDTHNDKPYSGYRKGEYTITPYAIHRKPQDSLDTNTVPHYMNAPDKAYSGFLLWVVYSDGGTFGFDSGQVDYIGIFDTAEECKAIRDLISQGGGGQGGDARPYKQYMNQHYGTDFDVMYPYERWVGWFTRLEDVRVEKFAIQ